MNAGVCGRRPLAPMMAAAGLVAFCCLGCRGSAPSPAAPAATAGAEPAVDVETTKIRRGSIPQRISAPGSVLARRESRIGAEVRGTIARVHVSEGDRVEPGAVLFELDPKEYEMGLREASAGLDVVRAERGQLESDLARARTLKRQRVISQQEIERITTSLAVAKARERRAEEALALARHNLERTVVRAPYGGSIAARLADEGTTALVTPQTIVIVLQETAELEARATIPESQLALVQVGDPALIHVEGLPDPVETQVSAVSDTIDPATRTYLVKMRVPNRDYRLKAGVFAHVEIMPRARSDVLVVPREAIRTEDGRTRVLVVRNEQAVAVAVEVGIVSEEFAEILQGVGVGDEVVIGEAARTIAPGMRVRIVKADAGSVS